MAGDIFGHTGDTDPRQVEMIPGRADVGGVGRRAATAGFVPGEQQQVVDVNVSRLPEGVVFLWRDSRRVALSPTHHLKSEASV